MRAALLTFSLFFLSASAHAERCEDVGGCLGNVFLMHVPREQIKSPSIFPKSGLPDVSTTVTLAADASLLDAFVFSTPPYPEQLKKDLALAAERGKALTGWGSILQKGSKVKILSYQVPQIPAARTELFALVLVLTD